MSKIVRLPLMLIVTMSTVVAALVASPLSGQPAAASGFTGAVTAPDGLVFAPSTAGQSASGFSIDGFPAQSDVLAVVAFVSAPTGTTFSIDETTGLTLSYGISDWIEESELSFTGTPDDVNAALASLKVSTSGVGDITIRVTATEAETELSYNPVNGHFYRFVSSAAWRSATEETGNPSWTEADTASGSASFEAKGVTGYLVTITSEAENDFVTDRIPDAQNVWIGASDAATEGDWRWVTGPEGAANSGGGTAFWSGDATGSAVGGSFESWNSSEPNNASTSEHHAVTNWNNFDGGWNDLSDTNVSSIAGFVVEYSEWNGQSFAEVASDTVTARTAVAATAVTGTEDDRSVTVSWTAPSAGTVSSYLVTATPGSSTCTTTATTCTVSNLDAGTPYTFIVETTFSDTSTEDSSPSAPVTPFGPPTSPSATPGDEEATVSWTAATSSDATPVVDYTVTASPGGATCTTAATSCTVTGLTNSTNYTFTVSADFGSGRTSTSSATSATTPETPPGAPTGLTVAAAEGGLDVSWTAPADTGSAAITGYALQVSEDAGTTWRAMTLADASATTTELRGLRARTGHRVRVAASNGVQGAFVTSDEDATPTLGFEGEDKSASGLQDPSDVVAGGATAAELGLAIELGPLASRSQRKPLTLGGVANSGTYTVTGTDSRTQDSYTFTTDIDYRRSGSGAERESDERPYDGSGRSFTFARSMEVDVRTTGISDRDDVLYLRSNGNCNLGNTFDGLTSYCSVFGPEVWSSPFSAAAGESLAFEYAARASDNFEVYAFLVEVDPQDDGTYDYGGGKDELGGDSSATRLNSHSLFLHRRGKVTDWTTATGTVPADGVYRFRFVDGAYDQSGGYALGTDFYIDPTSLSVALAQTITFPDPGDQIGATGTFSVTASSDSGLPVTVTSSTPSVCTIVGTTVTKLQTGTCRLSANAAGDGTYAAAATVTRTLTIRATASAPSNSGLPSIFGTPTEGNVLTLSDGTWSTGGSPVLSTTYQWTAGGTDIAGETDDALCLDASLVGEVIRVEVTQTNAQGSTTATSAATSAVSSGSGCAPAPAAPTLTATAGDSSAMLTVTTAGTVTNLAYRLDGGAWVYRDPAATTSPWTVSGLTNGTTYTIETRALNGARRGATSNAVSVTPSNIATQPPPAPPAPPAIVAPPLPPGPVLTAGTAPRPSVTPTARVGEREVAVASTPAGTARTEGTTTVSTATILEVGGVSLAVDVTGAGEVRTNAGAAPQISVARDSVARTSGGGLLPGTQVQAWLPLAGGTTVRPVTSLPVAADGTFTGELPFDGRSDRESDGRPLPIGTHVLQLVGVDAQGEVTVIEQTVRIDQPAPSPEPDRGAGAPPTLTPGASIATNAGVPEAVTVVPVPDARQARVEGSGWTMAVDVPSADGRVSPTEDGGALIELIEDDAAEVSGDGFLGGTRADVWLFSTPTLLGSVTIDADGTFSGEVPVEGIATGEHTLQLQGVGRDGYVRAANLGVVVVPRETDEPAAAPEPAPEPEAAPEPEPEPDDRVEVVTASGDDTGSANLLVWIALLAAAAGSGWWFLLGRRRRDDEDEDVLAAGDTTG